MASTLPGAHGHRGDRRDLASVFVSFTTINKLEVRPLLLLVHVSAGDWGFDRGHHAVPPFGTPY